MTREEFSNSFDTLLSSYLHNAGFGELSSFADVTLDEYEKSIFLTQALDSIVKSYFEKHLNNSGLGFDDSTRRLMDFANLVTTKTLTSANLKANPNTIAYSERGIVLSFNTSNTESNSFGKTPDGKYYLSPLFIINERVQTAPEYIPFTEDELENLKVGDIIWIESRSDDYGYELSVLSANSVVRLNPDGTSVKVGSGGTTIEIRKKVASSRSYVIVPINYKEYDRMMSRAYSEPLKRLAWRLFETDKSDLTISTELILRSDAGQFGKYVVRYIRRPRPIILVDLTNTDNGLSIEGVTEATDCELNPVIHNEILLTAVQLALTSRGIETRDTKALREAQNK